MTIGSKLYKIATCSDTMAWAKENLKTAPDGAVFLADMLMQARGRAEREWRFYPGQFAMTFILKPSHLATMSGEDLPVRLNQLVMTLSLGISDPLIDYGVVVKWPNDFFVSGKKLGGMLVHLVWEHGTVAGIVVGFALNVNNMFAADDPLYDSAISLSMYTGCKIDRNQLYVQILHALNQRYQQWQQGSFAALYQEWKSRQMCLGKRISVHNKDGSIVAGTAMQVMPQGDLMLKDDEGKLRIVSFYQVEDVFVDKT